MEFKMFLVPLVDNYRLFPLKIHPLKHNKYPETL